MPNKTKGIYFALLTACISGVSIFLNKFAVGAVTPPLYFTAIKNSAVAVLIISVVLASGKWKEIKKISKRETKYLLLIGLIGGSLPFYLYFTGLSLIPAVNSAIIHKTLIVWVSLVAVPLLKEKIGKLQALGVFLIFAGNIFIGGFEGFEFSKGELLVLIATILWAAETILAKKVLSGVSAEITALFRMGLGSAILMVMMLIFVPNALQKTISLAPQQLFWISLTILTLTGYVLGWYKALKNAPAITVTSILALSTLITNSLSAIFITHSWNITLALQTVMIISGILLIVYSNKNKSINASLETA